MRIASVLFGLILVGLGVSIAITGKLYSKYGDLVTDYGNYKYLVAILFISSGCLICFFSKKMISGIRKNFICPKCEETVESTKGNDLHCPKCNTKMESLKGFYDRHPERKKG